MKLLVSIFFLFLLSSLNSVSSQAHPELFGVESNRGLHYTIDSYWDITGGNNNMSNFSFNPTISWHKGNKEYVIEGFYNWGSWDNEMWLNQKMLAVRTVLLVQPNYAWDSFFQYQTDNIIHLDYRYYAVSGIRIKLGEKQSDQGTNWQMYFGSGIGLEWEYFSVDEMNAEKTRIGRWNNYITLLWSITNSLDISLSSHIQPNITTFSDFRTLVFLEASQSIYSKLNVVYSFRLRYDNDPVPGIKSTDYFGTVGLQFEF